MQIETQGVDLDGEEQEIHRTLSKNVVVSLITKIIYLVTRLVVPPFILKYLSLEEYGIWSYCFIFVSYLGMGVHGITNVYVRYGAIFAAKHDIDKINKLIVTGTVTVSALCLISAPIFWFGLPYLVDLTALSPQLYHTAVVLIFATMLIFMADMTVGVFGYILQSIQKIAAVSIIWTASCLIETVCIFIFLMMGMKLYGLLAAFTVRIIINFTLNIIVCYRSLPGISFRLHNFDRSMIKLFMHFGGIVQLSGLLGIANRSIKKVLSGLYISTEATALYELGEKFPLMAISLPETLNAILLPTTSHFHAKEMKQKIVEVYIKGSRTVSMMTGYVMGFLAAFAAPMTIAWLGPDNKYDLVAVIMAIFTLAYFMDIVTGPASAIYRSINQPRKELIYGLIQFILVILSVAAGFYYYGASVMVLNVCCVSMVTVSSIIYLVYSNRYFQIGHWHFILEVFVPGFFPFACAFALAWATSSWFSADVLQSRWITLGYLTIDFAIYTIATVVILWMVFCHKDERQHLKEQLRSLFK